MPPRDSIATVISEPGREYLQALSSNWFKARRRSSGSARASTDSPWPGKAICRSEGRRLY